MDDHGIQRVMWEMGAVEGEAELFDPCTHTVGHRRIVSAMAGGSTNATVSRPLGSRSSGRRALDGGYWGVGAHGPDLVIDLNARRGEVESPELLETGLLEIVTSANIATGAHAGNIEVMEAAVTYAASHGVAVGAHPSYRDRKGFGRMVLRVDPADLRGTCSHKWAPSSR